MYQSKIRSQKRGRHQKKREFVEIGEGQQYGIVQDMLGNGRVNVFCEDKSLKVARIRGSLRKYRNKVIIEKGDLVLVALREYGDDKVDLFHKYTSEEVSYLIRNDILPEAIVKKLQNSGDLMNDDGRDRDDLNYVVFMHPAPEPEPSRSGTERSAAASSDEIWTSSDEKGEGGDDVDIDII